jgi:hypothetical protein
MMVGGRHGNGPRDILSIMDKLKADSFLFEELPAFVFE